MTTRGAKNAFGMCDRTGKRYPLNELVEQYENEIPTGLLVGKDMLDIDHEQLQIGRVDASDDQTLDDPRPDTSQTESRALFAFDPVGGGLTEYGTFTVGLGMSGHSGKVAVS